MTTDQSSKSTADGNFMKTTTWGRNLLKTTTWGAVIGLSVMVGIAERGHHSAPVVSTVAATAAKPALGIADLRGGNVANGGTTGGSGQFPEAGNNDFTGAVQAPDRGADTLAAALQESSNGGKQLGAGQAAEASASAADDVDSGTQLEAKLSPDLQDVDPSKQVDVIVQYKSSAAPLDLSADGATTKSELKLVNAQLVTVSGANLNNLVAHNEVAYVSPDRPLKSSLDNAVSAVNGDLAYANGWNGAGVGIAVIDSGVAGAAPVSDLVSGGNTLPTRVVYNQSFVPNDTTTADAYGHGTHVAGIIAGNGYISIDYAYYPGYYRGLAPEAQIINLRVLNSLGAGTDSSVISAIQAAINLKSTYNIRVINLSLSRGVFESYKLDPLCQAAESAWKAGIVVVAAAGNMGEYNVSGINGYATVGAPGNDPYVITVGATNTHATGSQTSQTMTSYSSKGPTALNHIAKPDLAAPGNAIVSRQQPIASTLSTLFPFTNVYPCEATRTTCGSQYGPARYMTLSGTSMSTAVVSGVAALLLQKTPTLTPDQVKARLVKTAWKGFGHSTTATNLFTGVSYTIEQDLFAVGAGAVDASRPWRARIWLPRR